MTSAQLKNSFSSIGDLDASISPSTLELKICVHPQFVRYFVSSKTHNQIVFYGNYTLHHVSNDSELVERIRRIYEKDEVLQLSFSHVKLALDIPYSLVPKDFSVFLADEDQLIQPFDSSFDLLYNKSAVLVNALTELFGSVEISHINTSFVKLFPEALNESTDKLFLNLSNEHIDVLRFDAMRKLQLMNRYGYKDAKDFIYFVSLCCEDLNIDRETTDLVLVGEVDIQSRIYDMCYRYFRNISFINKPEDLSFAKAFDLFPKHLHFNLYNL